MSGTDLPIFPPPVFLSGGDFPLYSSIAESIVSRGDFGGEPQKSYGGSGISPGWSFFLVGFYFLFGKSYVALFSVSIFFGGLIALAVYYIANYFFNTKVAILAGIVSAIWPPFVIQTSAYGDAMIFYTVLLLWSFLFFAKGVLKERWLLVAFSGILIGFAALTEPIAFFIPLVFLLWALITRLSFRTLALTSVFLITFLLTLAPWSYRNLTVSESLSGTPLISKGELQLVSPDSLFLISKLALQDGVILSGLTKMFIFPSSIHLLDKYSHRSYKEMVVDIFSGKSIKLTKWETIILSTKITINTLHLLVLGFGVVGMFVFRSNMFIPLTILLLGYTISATIGLGLLQGDNFKNIQLLNGYLFPIIPLIIIIAAAFFLRSWNIYFKS